MLSISNLVSGHKSGNEKLRYGHRAEVGTPKPVVVWALTKACNLRCVHCYASAQPGPMPGELTNAEGKALLDDLRAFDVPAVLFSGGEPLVRPDALDLIGYARKIGLRCTLSTNGLLINDEMAQKLVDLDLQYAGISIDGTQKKHDKLRGMEGAYEGTLAGIDSCVRKGLKVGVRSTVHALNEEEMEDIFQLSLDHGVNRLCIYHLAYSGRGGKMQSVDLTTDRTRAVVDRIIDLTRRSHDAGHDLEVLTVGNHADAAYMLMLAEAEGEERAGMVREKLLGTNGNRSGCNIAAISPAGDVHYDQFSWHYKCGNIRDSSFSKIWTDATDPRLAIMRDRRAHLPQRCQECRFVSMCNGNLRTRAESATGDWLGMDPSCYLTEQETASPLATATA